MRASRRASGKSNIIQFPAAFGCGREELSIA